VHAVGGHGQAGRAVERPAGLVPVQPAGSPIQPAKPRLPAESIVKWLTTFPRKEEA
jgi:hypothetical protein